MLELENGYDIWRISNFIQLGYSRKILKYEHKFSDASFYFTIIDLDQRDLRRENK